MKISKRFASLSDNRKRGTSLPLIICVGAFLLAFSLALVYTSGLLMSSANQKADEERVYQLASSFAKEMDRELKKPDSGFAGFANTFLNSREYNEYNPDNPSTVYHYIAEDDADASYGNIKLHLYKEINEDENSSAYEGKFENITNEHINFTDEIENLKNKTFQRYLFTVEVIAQYKDLSYNYVTEYFREDRYTLEFSHNGNKIVWDKAANCWKQGDDKGAEYTAWQFPNAEPIQYRYLTEEPPLDNPVYQNVHEEFGMPSSIPNVSVGKAVWNEERE